MTIRASLCLTLATFGVGCTGVVSDPGDSIRGGANDRTRCVPGIALASRVPRLTNTQYDHTIQDLLHLDVTPSTMLAPESNGPIDQRAFDAYQASAERLAAQAMSTPSARAHIVPCAPSGDGAACATQLIESFGRRAFRRPLTSTEIGRFQALYAARGELTESGTFDEGATLLLEAFLQSPRFLLLAETSVDAAGDAIPLSDHEVATRLAYMLWNSMPDDVLLDAADAGALSTDDQILAQARRMLAMPRARANVAAFHRRWLGIEGSDASRWSEITRDPERYPEFSPSLVPLLSDEIVAYVEHVVFDLGGGFERLMLEPVAMVNARTAPLYGLDAGAFGEALEPAPLDPARRAGVLTRVGFLASHAMYDRTSPILRGAYVQKHIVCTPLGTPPPGAEMTPLPPPDPTLVTTRDRTIAQTDSSACATCHEYAINPVGFAFENFDALGKWRDTDNGAVVDATGTARMGREIVSFDGSRELSQAIAASPDAHLCYAAQWVEFAYRREANSQDRCIAEDMAERLADPAYAITDLLADLTQTESFRSRSTEVGP